MKFIALAAVAASASAHHHYPRRLDTTLVRFVDDEAYEGQDSLVRSIGSHGMYVDLNKYDTDMQGGQRDFSSEGAKKGQVKQIIAERPYDSGRRPFAWNLI